MVLTTSPFGWMQRPTTGPTLLLKVSAMMGASGLPRGLDDAVHCRFQAAAVHIVGEEDELLCPATGCVLKQPYRA